MLLTITTTYQPATDLGYLLQKHPGRPQTFSMTFGAVHLFYPEASGERCTAALLVDVDPTKVARGMGELEQQIRDRPYVAASFLCVALAEILRTAMQGCCEQRPELAQSSLPLCATLSAIQCRGGADLLKRLFEPLGYTVNAQVLPRDEQTYPAWDTGMYYDLTLNADCRLADLLVHLYVLLPVLNDEKHYGINHDEVDKLLRKGKGWLEAHPERELIAYRYLCHKPNLAREALARLLAFVL